MKVATILPTPLLGKEPSMDYNMCLFHIVRDNDEYASYFRELSEQGKFVIMDNGAAERVNPSHEELMEVYGKVNPTEIVLPDVVYDTWETTKRTREAYQAFVAAGLHEKYQFMAVPQGNDWISWLNCAKLFLMQEHITTIGISKFVTPKLQEELGAETNVRLECVDAILTLAKELNRDVQIHLLGCWESPEEVGEIDAAFGDKVRGTDSAIAYVFTRAGQVYETGKKRPDNYEIDFHRGTVEDLELLNKNMVSWIDACQKPVETKRIKNK